MSHPFDLGPWSRKITTESPDAQLWFDRGLNWTYAYNHEEAVTCFREALEHDPGCAMAWWGIAYASGPFYNRSWTALSDSEIDAFLPVCHDAARRAAERAERSNAPEQSLIDAIQSRYQSPDQRDRAVLDRWHVEFTDAMREVHRTFPEDLDIAALFAEAAVTCTPRQLWDMTRGVPKEGALTEEALAVLDRALEQMRVTGARHPGVPHMYIHALEMSPFPERALPAADLLLGHGPDAGHLEHMPAHIYVLCGDYAQAVSQSERAIIADDKYLAHAGDRNFYTTSRCHDLHLLIYAAMFLGQYQKALGAADRMAAMATPELITTSAPFISSKLDGYAAMRTHVLVRFGRWRDLTETPPPEDPALKPISAAMHAYGKGVAHAALGEIEAGERARETFVDAVSEIPEDMIFLSNTARAMLGVGRAMLDGELEYRKGNADQGFECLREAVTRDDALNYTEPWAWMHPPRHALGALLAEQGRLEEAETVFREDLGLLDGVPRCCQHPGNIWALRGLLACVEGKRGGGELAMLRQDLAIAQARADTPIESACFCAKSRGSA